MATMTDRPTNYLAPDKISADAVPIEFIRPSSVNPRKHFDETALAELAASIKAVGLLEPIVVRSSPSQASDKGFSAPFEIVAGERRWRAAKIAGLLELPIRNLGAIDDRQALQLAMIENLQRQDLDAIEEAEGYRALHDVAGMKQAAIAAAVHRSQPVIAGRIRLLELPHDVQERIRAGEISPSHGVALAKFSPFPAIASKLAEEAAKGHWSSGELEKPIPGNYLLQDAQLVRRVGVWDFDTTICKTNCPFGAYRSTGTESWQEKLCLRPDHYDQLTAEAKAAKDAAWREEENQRRAAVRATLPAGTELADVPDLPRFADMQNAELLHNPPRNPPDGCTEACPCRSQALDYQGRPAPICTDAKRYQRLGKAVVIAKNKARRAHVKELTRRLTDAIDALTTIGRKELILLSTQKASGLYVTNNTDTWDKAITRQFPPHPGSERLPVQTLQDIDAWVHSHDGTTVAKIAIEAICLAELATYYDNDNAGARQTSWYLGDITEEPK